MGGTVAGVPQIASRTPAGVIPSLSRAGTAVPGGQRGAHPPWGDAKAGVTHPPTLTPAFAPCPT